jgi:hypothetical protein
LETITLAFWISFAITLLLLVAALVTGFTHRRSVHLWLGPSAVVALVVAIVLAVLMGRLRVFPEGPMRVHRVFATTAGILAVVVVATGLRLVRRPEGRKMHRAAVLTFMAFALAASGTGVWAFSLSVPR